MKHLILLLVICLLVLISCCDERTVVCPDMDSNIIVNVSGLVRGLHCMLNENDFNNLGRELRYTAATGEKAIVRFTRLEGINYLTETDDSSMFKLSIDTGTYNIVVESGHAWPDSFYNVYIGSDTIFDLKILYDHYDSENISFGFYYGGTVDTLSESEERDQLSFLNSVTGDLFDPVTAIREVDSATYTGRTVYYHAPMNKPRSVWLAYDRCFMIINKPRINLSEYLEIVPAIMPCLAKKYSLYN